MHSMAGSAVGNTLRSAARGQTVVTVGVRWDAIGGQIIAQRQAFIAVTSSASGHGDARRVHQRSLLFRPEDQVFPVAVAAHGGGGHAVFHGLSVHAFQISLADVLVALPTRRRDIPVVNLGARILRGKNAMAPVTIRAARGTFVPTRYRSSMHALAIEFHGMGEWNLVPGEKLLIAVTGGTSVGQILLGNARSRVARGLNLMRGPMAGHAVWSVRVALRGRLPVYALPEILHLIGMALRALRRRCRAAAATSCGLPWQDWQAASPSAL